jgi:cancer susceptibility candidate protein 1
MPPLSKKKQAELAEQAMRQAAEDAAKLFKAHEKERRYAENVDKTDLDNEMFVSALEVERLVEEKDSFSKVSERLEEVRTLVFKEHAKHESWKGISHASRLPSVNSNSEINAFLSTWKEMEQENQFPRLESQILKVLRQDKPLTQSYRQQTVANTLAMCFTAKQLLDEIHINLDNAIASNDVASIVKHRQNLRHVGVQLLQSLDTMTAYMLQYSEAFHESAEEIVRWSPQLPGETFPEGEKAIKFGLWARMRSSEMTRHLPHLRFGDLGIALEPKEGSQRLPRALGLARDNAALRAIQLSFDPFSIFSDPNGGQEFYALDCVLIVEPVAGHEKTKIQADFLLRTDNPSSHVLTKHPYPGENSSESPDDGDLRLSFNIPSNVVIRHPGEPRIGIWNYNSKKWDPATTICTQLVLRRTAFPTGKLSTMAVVQEKGFDVPYASWQMYPLNDDQVMFVIEGRDDRGERLHDREVKIIVRDHECRLFAPAEKPELAELRENWVSPATLLRKLAKAGYNFVLSDKDAEYSDIKPKSKPMEQKCYSDIALFCTRHAFASSKQNKIEVVRENENLALFRVSKSFRQEGGAELLADSDNESKWHNVRYERDRCVVSSFREMDPEPNLSNAPGKLTHLNLFTMMQTEAEDPQDMENEVVESNKLLQRAVYQLLMITRPISWG